MEIEQGTKTHHFLRMTLQFYGEDIHDKVETLLEIQQAGLELGSNLNKFQGRPRSLATLFLHGTSNKEE